MRRRGSRRKKNGGGSERDRGWVVHGDGMCVSIYIYNRHIVYTVGKKGGGMRRLDESMGSYLVLAGLGRSRLYAGTLVDGSYVWRHGAWRGTWDGTWRIREVGGDSGSEYHRGAIHTTGSAVSIKHDDGLAKSGGRHRNNGEQTQALGRQRRGMSQEALFGSTRRGAGRTIIQATTTHKSGAKMESQTCLVPGGLNKKSRGQCSGLAQCLESAGGGLLRSRVPEV